MPVRGHRTSRAFREQFRTLTLIAEFEAAGEAAARNSHLPWVSVGRSSP
jgi:hypothetical protein